MHSKSWGDLQDVMGTDSAPGSQGGDEEEEAEMRGEGGLLQEQGGVSNQGDGVCVVYMCVLCICAFQPRDINTPI